jgi:1-aminocyclopropane-1-carboxylate deaminase
MVTIPDKGLIQSLDESWYKPYVKGIDMLRLDLLHPHISGNKWFKLKYNIQHAKEAGYNTVLTFGGAYSNHLAATAAAANAFAFGIKSIGIVRGKDAENNLNSTLQFCKNNGMQLVFVSREEYARKEDKDWLEEIQSEYNHPFIIPEGGANEWGTEGAAEIATLVDNKYTHVCVSVGTGTTAIGLRNGLPINTTLLAYAPIKGGSYLTEEIALHLKEGKNANWQLFDNWHFGGFGKYNNELLTFMNEFYQQHNIPLDIVYTSKMMYAVQEQLKKGFFPKDAQILCIHTGGMQGNTSVQAQLTY